MEKFSPEYLLKIVSDIFRACEAPAGEADIVARMLVEANLMGLDSHGVIRVPQYVRDVREGSILPGAPVTVLRETSTTAIIDANWNFGQVGALKATETAINKARKNMLGSVVLRRSRHVGCLGAYPKIAAEKNLVGMAVCGTAGEGHRVCPWGGREGRLATNPIAFAAPTSGKPFLLDFSTSMAPEGKIRLMLNRGEKLPEGWIIDNKGRPSTDPKDLYGKDIYAPVQGAILPFGGSQGYKGFALSMMAQILSSILGEPAWNKKGVEANANLMWLMVIDINAFMPPDEFQREMDEFIKYIKSSKLAEGVNEILIPGEREFCETEKRKKNGIPVEDETWRQITEAAKGLGVKI